MYKGLAILNVEFGLRICDRPNSPDTSKRLLRFTGFP